MIQLVYQIETLEEETCEVLRKESAIDRELDMFADDVEGEVSTNWSWGLELQYGIQILVYSCLLMCRSNCIVSELAIWFDEVNSRIV